MEYSIQAFSRLAGVSTRTLRYYDEIGLLKPVRVNSSGYRIYSERQLDTLRQIVFYRAHGLSLETIGQLLHAPDAALREALCAQRAALLLERERIDRMIDGLSRMLLQKEETDMNTQTKRKKMIEENEARYGAEIRGRYGDEVVDKSNARLMGLPEEALERMQPLADEINDRLAAAVRAGLSPDGAEGLAIAALHKEWLAYTWPSYSPEAHRALAQMYVDDERFTAYYDKEVPGCAVFLRDAVTAYARG